MSQRPRIGPTFRSSCRRLRLFAVVAIWVPLLSTSDCGSLAADGTKAQPPAPKAPKRIPPPGISVPPEKRAALEKELEELGQQIRALGRYQSARVRSLLPDVQVFWQAVHNALADREFFNPREIEAAFDLLREGRALRRGTEGKLRALDRGARPRRPRPPIATRRLGPALRPGRSLLVHDGRQQ